MERILARLAAVEKRMEWVYRKLLELIQWQRWAEQRIREIGQGAGVGYAAASTSSFDPNSVLAVAKVTSQISKAASATAAGSGTIQFYTSFSGGTLGTLGDTATCYSINQDYKVAVNATVFVEKRMGVWWVSTVDKCSNLVT